MFVSLTNRQPTVLEDVISGQIALALKCLMEGNLHFHDGEMFSALMTGQYAPEVMSVVLCKIPGSGIQLVFKSSNQQLVYNWMYGQDRVLLMNTAYNPDNGTLPNMTPVEQAYLVNRALRELIRRRL